MGIPDTYILCWFTEYYIICGHLKGKMYFRIIYSFIKINFKLKSIYIYHEKEEDFTKLTLFT